METPRPASPAPDPARFRRQLVSGLLNAAHSYEGDGNADIWRSPHARQQGWRDPLLKLAARRGWSQRRYDTAEADKHLAHIFENLDRYEQAWTQLADESSRTLFIELLKFRVLGRWHVRLPRDEAAFQSRRAAVEPRHLRQRATRTAPPWTLDRYEIAGSGGEPIRLDLHAYGFDLTFLQKHYIWESGGERIAVSPGDVVLDAGGCWGDTALFFADAAGPGGRVNVFEFDPQNLKVLRENLALNPRLAARIEVVERALWNRSDEVLRFNASGPSSRLVANEPASGAWETRTITIDEWAAASAASRVDFVKMDIEGAELPALRGAEATLRRFRPALAISLYHKPEDFFEIPEFLAGLGLGYVFHLGHPTMHLEETVLFASAR